MDYYRTIANGFQQTLEAVSLSVDLLADPMLLASQMLCGTLLEDGKVLVCGEGADAALATLLACHLNDAYLHERPALPVVNLAADGASLSAPGAGDEVFARQVRALGLGSDLLVCLCSENRAPVRLTRAIQAAQERGVAVILIAADPGDELVQHLGPGDVALRSAASGRPQQLELNTMIINGLCGLVDDNLFGAGLEEERL